MRIKLMKKLITFIIIWEGVKWIVRKIWDKIVNK